MSRNGRVKEKSLGSPLGGDPRLIISHENRGIHEDHASLLPGGPGFGPLFS
jgi:hypothetical protein